MYIEIFRSLENAPNFCPWNTRVLSGQVIWFTSILIKYIFSWKTEHKCINLRDINISKLSENTSETVPVSDFDRSVTYWYIFAEKSVHKLDYLRDIKTSWSPENTSVTKGVKNPFLFRYNHIFDDFGVKLNSSLNQSHIGHLSHSWRKNLQLIQRLLGWQSFTEINSGHFRAEILLSWECIVQIANWYYL